MPERALRVAVIGSGNIGIDLCERLLRDPDFEVVALVGRRTNSPGLKRFESRIPHIISEGIRGLLPIASDLDGIFDASSALDHERHWRALSPLGLWMIDLTPSQIGHPMVPALVEKIPSMEVLGRTQSANFSMVTCGGQSAAPLLYSIATHAQGIREVEVSSSIAAVSAGPATRQNIDHYIQSTEGLASLISGCASVKAILVLNPATPPVMMRTTVTVEAEGFDLAAIAASCVSIAREIREAVPGYEITVSPHSPQPTRIVVSAKVEGAGYYLPKFAGNLDIINAAAVETARKHGQAVQLICERSEL